MSEIDYGRLDAIEAALGGRAAIQSAYGDGRTLVGGGGGGAGSPIVHKLPFAHDTPEIAIGNAHPIYTPTVDDLLLDAWIDVEEGWNGTTPFADIGQSTFVAIDGSGLFVNSFCQQGIDLSGAADDWDGITVQASGNSNDNPPLPLTGGYVTPGSTPPSYVPQRFAPARFNTVDPLFVWVTQNGQPGGASPGSTVGSAHLYLVTVTPAT